jgi:hypothetical protein
MNARAVHIWLRGCFLLFLAGAGLGLPAAGQNTANTLPPGVTVAMEQDFLARYEAVMKAVKAAKETKDQSALTSYYALFAMAPSVPPEGRKAFEDLSVIALGMNAMGGEPSYAFIPLQLDDKTSGDGLLTLAGKVYTGYLPPVVSLKTTFAAPEHPDPNAVTTTGSTLPLCVENGRLMLIGIKPVPGAVPPPLDNPAENFGLTPNHLREGDTNDDQDFASLDKFLAALKQPKVQVLDSGQNDYVYYAICRVDPDLFVYVESSRPEKDNFSYTHPVTDSSGAELQPDKKQITLAEDPAGLDGKAVPILQGDVFHPAAGPVTVAGKYGSDFSNLKPDFSKTVDWK